MCCFDVDKVKDEAKDVEIFAAAIVVANNVLAWGNLHVR